MRHNEDAELPGPRHQHMRRRWLAALLPWLIAGQPSGYLWAQTFLENAELVDVRLGQHSYLADDLSTGTGNLAGGGTYSFEPWYRGDFADLRLTMITPVNPNFGVFWGFGTGESGEKYQIDPSVKVGFLAVEPVSDNATLSLSMAVVVGGYLREEACTADYGAIGGVQRVNCRLADSILPPDETLKYLIDAPPSDQVTLSLRYELKF